MKLILVLSLCALVAAAPRDEKPSADQMNALSGGADRNWAVEQAVNLLIRQLVATVRRIINNGSELFGIPPLDPLEMEHIHVYLPLGLINLDLDLNDVRMSGLGGFRTHTTRLNLADLTFDLDITVPSINVSADPYELLGDLFTAIPLYGKGKALFKVDGLRFQARLFLEQSEDGKSVILGSVRNVAFQIPSLKSGLTGVIGGGDIDGVVNAVIEEVIVDYVNRFQGAISAAIGKLLPSIANPVLEQLDTWQYIAALPRPRSG